MTIEFPLGKANKITKGKDITLVSMSYMTVEALIAQKYLKKYDISLDLIDLRTVKPIDFKAIVESLKVTKRNFNSRYGSLNLFNSF